MAKPFEKTKKDTETKGGPKEGSRKEEAMDRKQAGFTPKSKAKSGKC